MNKNDMVRAVQQALGVDVDGNAGLGLEWCGKWKTIQDELHFQLRPNWAGVLSEGNMLAELRSRKELGKGAYA